MDFTKKITVSEIIIWIIALIGFMIYMFFFSYKLYEINSVIHFIVTFIFIFIIISGINHFIIYENTVKEEKDKEIKELKEEINRLGGDPHDK